MAANFKKILIPIVSIFILAFALAGCAGTSTASNSSEPADQSEPTIQDYGWLSFQLPQGWENAKQSDSYETIIENGNESHVIKFMVNTLNSSFPTAADKEANDIAKKYNHYTEADPIKINDKEWAIATFEFNGHLSFAAYTDLDESKCLKITFYEMTPDDPIVQTILSTIEVDPEAVDAVEEEENSEEAVESNSEEESEDENTEAVKK